MATQEEIEMWRARREADGEEMSPWVLAVVTVVTREINILRAEHSLAPRTRGQVATAIHNAMDDPLVD